MTHRRAPVRVVNNTGKTLLSVTVSHKYSDNYKNEHTWTNVQNGQTTDEALFVDYNTGFLTTGRDWWFVSAIDDKGVTYITDPPNGRAFLDVMEKCGNTVLGPIAAAAAKMALGSPEPVTKLISGAVAATTGISTLLLNKEGTTGFKQHILRSDDQSGPNLIILKNYTKDGCEFRSHSGSSSTVWEPVKV
ncbi:MAG: hypothetical protein U1E70_28175 [Acetobacteraceae bacterium]|nr:hypothetical protein [Pseudomonadota bacterium]